MGSAFPPQHEAIVLPVKAGKVNHTGPFAKRGHREERKSQMINALPADIDNFLVALGNFEEGNPEVFEQFAKKTANLLWGKHVMCVGDNAMVRFGAESPSCRQSSVRSS